MILLLNQLAIRRIKALPLIIPYHLALIKVLMQSEYSLASLHCVVHLFPGGVL